MSFVPPRILKRIFPPTVTGVVVLLIGAKLVGESGALNWMGGSGACRSRPAQGLFAMCPTINAPHPLPWGSAEFLGLGFLSFMTIISTSSSFQLIALVRPSCARVDPDLLSLLLSLLLPFLLPLILALAVIEFVGSPAMRSASIILGLAVGCLVAGPLGYIDSTSIRTAPAITFLWVEYVLPQPFAPSRRRARG